MKKTSGARGRPRDPSVDEAVLQATLALLARDGYARMSVDAVACEAGVGKPTIYRRWGSKEDLATAALRRSQSHEQAPPEGGSLEDKLIFLLRVFQRSLMRPNGMAMIGALLVEEGHNPELMALFRERIVAHRRGRLRRLLERARGTGEIRPDTDVDVVVNLLVGSFYARYLERGSLPRDWARRVVRTALSGLRAAY